MYRFLQEKNINNFYKTIKSNFIEKNIIIKPLDYYYTNPIARSSKTMNDCREVARQKSFNNVEEKI